jgi:tetratricopeptide (TPR) repeat protein
VRATARHALGDLAGAIEDATHAIEVDPRCAAAYGTRGVVRDEQGDHKGALEDLTRVIELAPDKAPGWADRAATLLDLDEVDAAIADATRAIDLNPRLARAYGCRGEALARKGDRRAAPDYRKFLELAPGSPEEPRIRDWLAKNAER